MIIHSDSWNFYQLLSSQLTSVCNSFWSAWNFKYSVGVQRTSNSMLPYATKNCYIINNFLVLIRNMSNLLPVALRDHGLLGDEHLLGRNLDTHITPEKIILIPTDVFPKQWKIGDKSIKIQTLTEDLRFNLSKKKSKIYA